MREASNHSMGPDCLLGWRRQRLASGVAGVGSRSIHSKLAGDKLGILGRSEEREGERAARDIVTCLPCRHPPIPTSLPLQEKLCPPASPARIPKQVDDELRSPTTVSLLQVGPPTRRELVPGHAPLIFDREALRADTRLLCGIRRENGLE